MRRVPGWSALGALLAGLALLTYAVSRGAGPVGAFDHAVGAAALDVTRAHPVLRRLWLVDSIVEQPAVLRTATAALAITLAIRGRRRVAAVIAAGLVTSTLVSVVLKVVIGRPRPTWPDPVTTATGFAYPSGHTTAAWAFATCLVLALSGTPLRPGWRRVASAAGGLAAVIVSADRVFLGVHFPTDVLAGALCGVLSVLLPAQAACAATTAGRSQVPDRSAGPQSSHD